jgi:hypothetical protein
MICYKYIWEKMIKVIKMIPEGRIESADSDKKR